MDNTNRRGMGFTLMTSSHTRFHQIHQPIESSSIYRLRLDSAFTAYNLEGSYHPSHAQQAIFISAKGSRFHMSTQNPVHPVIELRVALTTRDYERLVKFYSEGLGHRTSRDLE